MEQNQNNLAQKGLEILLCAIAVIMLVPLVIMVSTSFKAPIEAMQFPLSLWPKRFIFSNYNAVWRIGHLGRAFINSIFVAGSVTFLVLFTSSLVGYIFAKKQFKGRDQLFLLAISPLMIPLIILLIPLFVLMVKLNLVNTYTGLILPFAFSAYGIFLMRQFIASLPNDLFDAAKIDGASELQVYFFLLLPLCKPILSALGIFTFLGIWDAFLWPLVMITSQELKVLPLALCAISQARAQHFGHITAAACIVIIPVVVVYFFFQKNFIKGITLTGLKG